MHLPHRLALAMPGTNALLAQFGDQGIMTILTTPASCMDCLFLEKTDNSFRRAAVFSADRCSEILEFLGEQKIPDPTGNAFFHQCIGTKPISALSGFAHNDGGHPQSCQLLLIGAAICQYTCSACSQPQKCAISKTRGKLDIGRIFQSIKEICICQSFTSRWVQNKVDAILYRDGLKQRNQLAQTLGVVNILEAM